MNIDRLQMLADYLEGVGAFEGRGVPKNKFDLQLWMAAYQSFDRKFTKVPEYKFQNLSQDDIFVPLKTIKFKGMTVYTILPKDCKTAGCAVGWATTLPEFNNEGLYYGHTDDWIGNIIYIDKSKNFIHTGFYAVQEFFDINTMTAQMLFERKWYSVKQRRNPKAVATRIKYLLKHDEKLFHMKYNWCPSETC